MYTSCLSADRDAELSVSNELQANQVADRLCKIKQRIISLAGPKNKEEIRFLLSRLIWVNSQLERYETRQDYNRLFNENYELKSLLNLSLEVSCPSDCQNCIWARYCSGFTEEVMENEVSKV